MNHGSELVIHAQQYIGEQGHLTYNGGHLLLNVTTIGMDFGLSRLGIGEDVSRFWYRTDDDAGYTEIDTSVQEKLDSFFEVKETNHAYLELTDVDPDQQESETYDLWVAGTQVKKTNQKDVLDDGTVSYDPNTHTLTLNNAVPHAGRGCEEGIYLLHRFRIDGYADHYRHSHPFQRRWNPYGRPADAEGRNPHPYGQYR